VEPVLDALDISGDALDFALFLLLNDGNLFLVHNVIALLFKGESRDEGIDALIHVLRGQEVGHFESIYFDWFSDLDLRLNGPNTSFEVHVRALSGHRRQGSFGGSIMLLQHRDETVGFGRSRQLRTRNVIYGATF